MKAVLLNGVEFLNDKGEMLALPPRKCVSLLAYLVVHQGISLDRAKVAMEVWQFASPKQARDSLRNALSVLRRFLPPSSVSASASKVSLAKGTVVCDLFEDDVTGCPGAFMPGFDDPWIQDFREAHRAEVIRNGMQQAQACWEAGAFEDAMAKLDACCSLDPLHFGAATRRVALLTELGYAVDSARAASAFSQRAIRDLGIISNIRSKPAVAVNPLLETEVFLRDRDPEAAAEFLVATARQWESVEAGAALEAHERALVAFQTDSPVRRRLEAQTLYLLWINGGLGPHLDRAKRSLWHAEKAGEEACASTIRIALSYGYLSAGEFAKSVQHARQEHASAVRQGDPGRMARSCLHLGIVEQHTGRPNRFADYVIDAAKLYEEHGSAHDQASISQSLGSVALQKGDLDIAAERFATARSYFEASGYHRSALWTRVGEAELLIASEDLDRSRETLLAIREFGVGVAGHSLIACIDELLAKVGCLLGDYDEGTLAYARAAALRIKLGTVPSVHERRTSKATRQTLRARMSRREIATAYERARAELHASA